MMKIYEFAATYTPLNGQTQLIVKPQTVLAADDKAAGILAARSIPGEYAEKLEQVEIVVRLFK